MIYNKIEDAIIDAFKNRGNVKAGDFRSNGFIRATFEGLYPRDAYSPEQFLIVTDSLEENGYLDLSCKQIDGLKITQKCVDYICDHCGGIRW
jgi:hypothetical protein